MEWHINSGYPTMYRAEANSKWRQYPPPYQGGYATPWAWIDGKNRSYQYAAWAGYVSSAMLIPTDINMNMTGEYNPSTHAGSITAVIYNSAGTALNAALQVAITEDSIHYTAPNGDPWHNHVLRDYVPDQNGTPISIAAGAYDTVTVEYTLDPSWVEHFTSIVAYVQSSTTQADSSRPVYQSRVAPLLSFTGTEEPRVPRSFYDNVTVAVGPNPCRANAQFRFTGKAGEGYRLAIYARDGRLVRELAGTIGAGANTLIWDRTDVHGQKVAGGVYGYRLVSTGAAASGKLVLAN